MSFFFYCVKNQHVEFTGFDLMLKHDGWQRSCCPRQEVKTALQVHESKLCSTEVCFKILIRFVTFYTLFIEKSDYMFDSD